MRKRAEMPYLFTVQYEEVYESSPEVCGTIGHAVTPGAHLRRTACRWSMSEKLQPWTRANQLILKRVLELDATWLQPMAAAARRSPSPQHDARPKHPNST